jgi:LmbE family N-acetylglucosaminyl deacetylase
VTDVVVSPHLDDAVLSCTGRLLDGDVTVVTVCAGVPAAGSALSDWDMASGATDARRRGIERIAEDDAALGLLGVPTQRLDELGEHYRGAAYDVDRVAERLVPLLTGADAVWVAAGLGGHGAHVGTREATMRAAAAAGVRRLLLYADLPYALSVGWPESVDGLLVELARVGVDPTPLVPIPRRLTAQEQRLKRAALACYRSQLGVLNVDAEGRFDKPGADEREFTWLCPAN